MIRRILSQSEVQVLKTSWLNLPTGSAGAARLTVTCLSEFQSPGSGPESHWHAWPVGDRSLTKRRNILARRSPNNAATVNTLSLNIMVCSEGQGSPGVTYSWRLGPLSGSTSLTFFR